MTVKELIDELDNYGDDLIVKLFFINQRQDVVSRDIQEVSAELDGTNPNRPLVVSIWPKQP